ncbi:ATP-binding cassette domain-containing protein [Nocardiopsis oceani]
MDTSIRAEGLVKRFGGTLALAGVDLAVPAGSILALLGPNGAGKTTAVRVLATLERPDEGGVWIDGHDALRDPVAVRRRLGLTGQYASVDENFTGAENLELVGRLLGASKRSARRRSAELIERFGLTEAAHRPVRTYSGGMRRRVDLAASLVGDPTVLCLDEPTTGLDPHSRNQLWEIVRGLSQAGTTVLLTTQYLEEAEQLADDVVVIDHGRTVAEGTPKELKQRIGSQTLYLRPVHPGDLGRAGEILTGLLGGSAPARDTAKGTITAPVDDPVLLSALVRHLDQEGIGTDELALRLPSLDDVFLTLTGSRR